MSEDAEQVRGRPEKAVLVKEVGGLGVNDSRVSLRNQIHEWPVETRRDNCGIRLEGHPRNAHQDEVPSHRV